MSLHGLLCLLAEPQPWAPLGCSCTPSGDGRCGVAAPCVCRNGLAGAALSLRISIWFASCAGIRRPGTLAFLLGPFLSACLSLRSLLRGSPVASRCCTTCVCARALRGAGRWAAGSAGVRVWKRGHEHGALSLCWVPGPGSGSCWSGLLMLTWREEPIGEALPVAEPGGLASACCANGGAPACLCPAQHHGVSSGARGAAGRLGVQVRGAGNAVQSLLQDSECWPCVCLLPCACPGTLHGTGLGGRARH